MKSLVALVGDRHDNVLAHRALPQALALAAAAGHVGIAEEWISTEDVSKADLFKFSGIWCVPASPYRHDENALAAIRFARERAVPFLGTCGGYQYAALEFARNVLGHMDAENQETHPQTSFPLIAALSCSLVEMTDKIYLEENSLLFSLYGQTEGTEEYHCRFGINRKYLSLFEKTKLRFSVKDAQGDPRGFELQDHPFFVGTAFQPERSALKGLTHPVIERFVAAVGEFSIRARHRTNVP